MRRMGVAVFLTILTGWQAFGQSGLVFDSSGNSKLNGTYYFREVIWALDSSSGDAIALYGTITFTGSGTYSANATEFDYSQGGTGTGTASGSYTIGAGGFGYIASPLYGSGVQIRGMVANGVFIGSATEGGFNDIFVAGLIPSPTPAAANFSGSYQMAYVNYPSPVDGSFYDAQFTLSPNGAGSASTACVISAWVESDDVSPPSLPWPATRSGATAMKPSAAS